MNGSVFLNIDSIVLDGFDHIDRRVLAEALQQALVEQLAVTDIGHSTTTPLARTHITLQESCSAAQLGQSLARKLGSIIRNGGGAGTANRTSEQGAEPNA